MTRKILTYIGLLLFAASNTNIFAQDSIFVPKHKFEVGLNYAIQRPFYSLTSNVNTNINTSILNEKHDI